MQFSRSPNFRLHTLVPFASRHADDSTSNNVSGFEGGRRTPRCSIYIFENVLALSPRLFLLPHLGSISFMRQFGNPVGIVKERKTRLHRSRRMNSQGGKVGGFCRERYPILRKLLHDDLSRFSEMENGFAPILLRLRAAI